MLIIYYLVWPFWNLGSQLKDIYENFFSKNWRKKRWFKAYYHSTIIFQLYGFEGMKAYGNEKQSRTSTSWDLQFVCLNKYRTKSCNVQFHMGRLSLFGVTLVWFLWEHSNPSCQEVITHNVRRITFAEFSFTDVSLLLFDDFLLFQQLINTKKEEAN